MKKKLHSNLGKRKFHPPTFVADSFRASRHQ